MKKTFITIFLIISINVSYSQVLSDSSYFLFDSITNFYTPKKKVLFSQVINNSSPAFKITNPTTLQENWVYTDATGLKHHSFTQLVNGIPIEYSQINFRENNDSIVNATGLLNINCPVPVINISDAYAISIVLNKLNCYKYKWQDSTYEADIKIDKNDTTLTYYPKPKLVVTKLNKFNFSSSDNFVYAYPVCISAIYSSKDSIYVDSVYYVNASNGNIIKRYSTKATCYSNPINKSPYSVSSCAQPCIPANVTTHYYGGQSINTERFLYGLINCTHRLKDICTGTYLYVKYLNSSANEKDFRNNPNTWASGGNPSDKVGATAMWCLEKSHEFYRNVFNRNSFDNNFSQIKLLIATNTSEKTSWSLIDDYMTVGLATGTSSWEETLDIIGHELTHGVTDKICYLFQDATISKIDEEGALGEGYGDIFGQAIEHYVHSNYSTTGAIDDYFQGSNIPGGLTYQKQRFLDSPKTNGHPDTYTGINYLTTAPLGVSPSHRNSTVLSHWFYLLAEGGSNTNDLGNAYCVREIGKDKATQIAYLSLYYLSGTSKQFANARTATIQAATNLYGANSNEVAQVTAAWYAVGVGSQYAGQIDVKNMIFNAPQNFHYNSKITVQNVSSNPSAGLIITSNTEIELLSEINFNSGSENQLYIAPACAGGARMGNPNNGGNSSSNQSITNEDVLTRKIKNETVQAFYDLSVFPNPSNDNCDLKFKITQTSTVSSTIVDINGRVVLTIISQTPYAEGEYTISTATKNLINGVYIIKTYIGSKLYTNKLIVNHE